MENTTTPSRTGLKFVDMTNILNREDKAPVETKSEPVSFNLSVQF